MTARALTVRPGFALSAAFRQWRVEAAKCEGVLCTIIAFVLGILLTLVACA